MLKRLSAALGTLCLATLPAVVSAQVAGVDLRVDQVILTAPSQGASTLVRITVTNVGTEPAGIFQVIGGVTNASLSSVGGAAAACAKGRNSVYTCGLTGLAPGLSTDIVVSARVDNTATSFSSRASTSGAADVNFANNSSTVTAAVVSAPADVQMSGSASTRQPRAGTSFDYTYQVKVGGNVPATGVVFTATLPPEVELVGVGTSLGQLCTFATSAVSCTLGDIGNGSVTVTITVNAPGAAGVSFATSAVALAGDGRDANLSNNSVSLDVTTR